MLQRMMKILARAHVEEESVWLANELRHAGRGVLDGRGWDSAMDKTEHDTCSNTLKNEATRKHIARSGKIRKKRRTGWGANLRQRSAT